MLYSSFYLISSTVIYSKGKSHTCVFTCCIHKFLNSFSDIGIESALITDHNSLYIVFICNINKLNHVKSKKLHQSTYFNCRSFPILGRKSIYCKVLNSKSYTVLNRFFKRLTSGFMSHCSWQVSSFSPSAIAVQYYGNAFWYN